MIKVASFMFEVKRIKFYKFGFVEFFNGADIRPPCLKGRFPHSVGEMSRSDKGGRPPSEAVRRTEDWECKAFRVDVGIDPYS